MRATHLSMRRSGLTLLLGCLVCAGATAASEPLRTVTMAPNPGYGAGWFHNFFLGEHWRDSWTTQIEVPLLDLDTFDGGLRPDRRGGGTETTNLHFKSANGNTWAFRSVDKDPRQKLLDEDTRNSWIGDLFKDEVSSAQPYGALLVPPLLNAADVLHTTPKLTVLPDDPRLGDFHQYAGMIGLIDERVEREIEGATMVADTLTLFQRLEEHNDERVDARGYLRARLIDILVGDWDRQGGVGEGHRRGGGQAHRPGHLRGRPSPPEGDLRKGRRGSGEVAPQPARSVGRGVPGLLPAAGRPGGCARQREGRGDQDRPASGRRGGGRDLR